MDSIKTLWVDLETTGIDPCDSKIIELAAICNDKVFHEYCIPDYFPIKFHETTEITGITWEFLKENGISEREIYIRFIVFLDYIVDKFDKSDKMFFCGFSTKFDSDFIRELFKKNRNNFYGSYFYSAIFDVMSVFAGEAIAGKVDIPENFQLSTLCKEFNIEFKAHSAIEDIKATIRLYEKLQRENVPCLPENNIEKKLIT